MNALYKKSSLLHPSSAFITGVGARSKSIQCHVLYGNVLRYISLQQSLLHLKESCPLVLPEQKALYATIKTTFIVIYPSLWIFRKQKCRSKLISVQETR